MNLKKELLQKKHFRDSFDCGVDSLNRYIKKQARQDIRKKLAVCYVFTEEEQVRAYYTLSSGSIPLEDIPEKYRKRFPKGYNRIPVILLGRLAVDKRWQGKKTGSYLLIDALKESYEVSEKKIGAVAVIVDPVNENAERFYERFGFIKLPGSGKMFIPMQTVKKLFTSK